MTAASLSQGGSFRRLWRRTLLGFIILLLLLVAAIGFGFLWLRTSLPQLDGTVQITLPGLQHAASIGRDDNGYVAITADNDGDAAFALGFAHAQDRLFQMDAMRRLGSGRLSEIIGSEGLYSDRRMRILGIRQQAQAQWDHASPALKAELEAYAAGVNAFLAQRHGALPPEFVILNYQPEPWSPVDSLIWGRLMALQLSQNSSDEILSARLKAALPDDLFHLLTRRGSASSEIDTPARTDAASNNWVVAGTRTKSGKPILANDPHLGLTAPSPWYLARIETQDRTLIGATAPGLPMLIIGSNGHVAWGLTTTGGDAQDIFDEKLDRQDANRYLTPMGSQLFETRHETIKVRWQADVDMVVRSTRHGPLISDAHLATPQPGHVLSIAWTANLPNDNTAEALLKMNRAETAADFREALRDFAVPQENIVYADVAGAIGFVAAARIPIRRNLYDHSRLPAPGWTDAADWMGMIPFDDLPQQNNPNAGWLATANNDVTSYAKGAFFGESWDIGYRFQRIAAHLVSMSGMTLADSQALQRDIVSIGTKQVLAAWLPQISTHPDIVAALKAWNGEMRRDQAEPLIVTSWIDHVAHRLLAKRLGDLYVSWWFWQTDVLTKLTADDHWCDDPSTEQVETCRQQLSSALDDTLADLSKSYGSDWTSWRWGKAHRVAFENQFWRNVPVINRLLRTALPDDGDNVTVDCAAALPSLDGHYQVVHGPSMRFSVDMAQPLSPIFALAGGQSGNPLSPHYMDQLPAWRDGIAKPILTSITHHLILQPTTSVQ